MRKILVLLSIIMMFGLSNIALAVEKPVMVETEAVQEEIIIEEVYEEETEEIYEDEEVYEEIEEDGCPHTWGEWIYDLTENDGSGNVTYFRYCDCGAYEVLDEETYCDSGGQYENCEVGRHYWCEEDGIRYCEECGYAENDI